MGKVSTGLVIVSFMLAGVAQAGSAWDELTPDQQAQIRKGEQVFVTQEDPSSAWPKAWVYRAIDSTPEEAAAVYTDYEAARLYTPNLKRSQISKIIDPRTIEVDYLVNIPLFPDEKFTVRNVLGPVVDGTYRVDWTLVRASSTKASVGNARFEPLGTQTLFAYYNFVTPGSSLAGMVRDRAMKQVQETVKAIAGQIVKERTSEPDHLAAQLQKLRDALASLPAAAQ